MEEVQKSWVVRRSLMDPNAVARASLEGFARGQLLLVPGRINRMFVGLARLLPRETVGLAAADTYGLRNGGRS